MKAFLITLVILLGACLIRFVRQGADFHIAQVLPFCGGFQPSLYDVGSIVLIIILLVRLSGMRHRGE